MSDEHGLLIVLSGPPGAGKTTIAGKLARQYDKAVHLHTGNFWRYILSGGVAPFEPEAHNQKHVVLDVIASAAIRYAVGGFVTVVDGVVGPWMLHHFLDQAHQHPDVLLHYVVLRPPRAVTARRAQQRTNPTALIDEKAVLSMWDQFADLGTLETRAFDNSRQTPQTSLDLIADAIEGQRFRLSPSA